MTFDEYRSELPHLPEKQVWSCFVYRESGWEWRGEDGEGNIEMTRGTTHDTSDAIFITPDGKIKPIPPAWVRNK